MPDPQQPNLEETSGSDVNMEVSYQTGHLYPYVVCSKCADELAALSPPQSLQDYAAIDVGFTDYGIQVWCRRHKANIVHIDFQGAKMPADFRRLETS